MGKLDRASSGVFGLLAVLAPFKLESGDRHSGAGEDSPSYLPTPSAPRQFRQSPLTPAIVEIFRHPPFPSARQTSQNRLPSTRRKTPAAIDNPRAPPLVTVPL